MTASRYDDACRRLDQANSDDPRSVEAEGRSWPQEVLYSRRMVEWVEKLAPGASEELRLAARAQHVRRWTTPRSSYPEGRTGYLRWREALKKFHADTAGEILRSAGYGDAEITKVATLLVRKNLAADPEGQILEDAACLVFLQFEFSAFAEKTEDAKVVDILAKTWAKMSDAARSAARGLGYGTREKALLDRALSGSA